MPLCGKDFVLVIYEGELESRRATSSALDLSAQMGMVARIQKLGSMTLPREEGWRGLPCESGYAYVAGVVVIKNRREPEVVAVALVKEVRALEADVRYFRGM